MSFALTFSVWTRVFRGLGRARTSVFQPELLIRGLGGGLRGRTLRSCVQPEHEEEWMEWVDWAQVEGQASGSSSNLAAMFDGHFVSVGF